MRSGTRPVCPLPDVVTVPGPQLLASGLGVWAFSEGELIHENQGPVEDEYWAYQYKTNVTGAREQMWWPQDGTGYFDSPEVAARVARRSGYPHVRLVHVERKRRFVELPPEEVEES